MPLPPPPSRKASLLDASKPNLSTPKAPAVGVPAQDLPSPSAARPAAPEGVPLLPQRNPSTTVPTKSSSPRTRKPTKPSGPAKLFVLDTNVLLHDPMSLFRFAEHDLFLPMITLEELDGHKKGMSEVARNARQVSRVATHQATHTSPRKEWGNA